VNTPTPQGYNKQPFPFDNFYSSSFFDLQNILIMELTQTSGALATKTQRFLRLLGIAFLIFISLNLGISTLFELMGVVFEQPYLDELSRTELFIIGVVVAPILESGLIIGILWLVQLFAPRSVALILMAAAFGALHISPGVHWGVVGVTIIMGYLLGYYYYKTRSQKLSGFWFITILHALNNLTAFLINGMM
jgi:membrane protease YdiL (CAAX protease family)